MKVLITGAIGLTFSLLLFSCQSKGPTDTNSESANNNIEVAQKGYEDGSVGQLDSLDLLCAASKLYKKEEWDEENHCRWALEKRVLSQIPEYAKRSGDKLSLQVDNGQWLDFVHDSSDPAKARYFQFRKHLATPHYYILTQLQAGECHLNWFVDGKEGARNFFPGQIWKHPVFDVFITGSAALTACPKENHIISFDKSGEIKSKVVKMPGVLVDVKWSAAAAFLQLIQSDGTTEYRTWVLP